MQKCTVVDVLEMGTVKNDIVTPYASPYMFSTVFETHLEIDDVINTLKKEGSLNDSLQYKAVSLFLINMTHVDIDPDKLNALTEQESYAYLNKHKKKNLTLTLLYEWNGIDPDTIDVPDVYHYLEAVMSADYVLQIKAPYSLDALVGQHDTREYFAQ